MKKTADVATGEAVIGGKKVDAATPFAKQVMYLAMGVEIEKSAQSTNVSWRGHCTASAISKKVVLTAAHCVQNSTADQVYLILDQNPENQALNLSHWYGVEKIQMHEGYLGQGGGYKNDLALLLLQRELPAERVSKIATVDQVTHEMDFIVAGYGLTTDLSDEKSQAASSSDGLNYVVKKADPINLAENFFTINQNDHKGFCNGDSGGPGLIQETKTGEYLIMGVVSNVSMYEVEDQKLDPNQIYSLCIGTGNYTNTLKIELKRWIDATKQALENPTAPNIATLPPAQPPAVLAQN